MKASATQPANRPSGLFHTEADLRLARANLDKQPIQGALALLETPQVDPLDSALMAALRGQLLEKPEDGYRAAEALNELKLAPEADPELESLKRALGWMSVVAMLRGHPAWQGSWLDDIAAWLDQVADTGDPLRELWLGAVTMAAGILLESDERIERGAAVYRRAVDERIHPEGYLKGIADVVDGEQRYEAQVSGLCALVLLAEMAGQVGLNLWDYDSRAVSIATAVAYTHFYYFFPEKWRWEAGLTAERTREVMAAEGAFMELANRRNPPQGIEQFLAERRPLFCAWGGGLTSLTHGLAPPKKRRWRLW